MPSQQRRKLRLAISATLTALGALFAITLLVVFLARVTSKAPSDDEGVGNNQASTVHVDAGGSKSIYTKPSTDADIGCTVRGEHGQRIYPVRYDVGAFPTSQWRARFYFNVTDSGDYTVRCSGPSDIRYGVGEYVANGQFTYLFWGIGLGIVVAIAGFALFVITMIRAPKLR